MGGESRIQSYLYPITELLEIQSFQAKASQTGWKRQVMCLFVFLLAQRGMERCS